MSINLHLPENIILKPCITVFGVGGAGCNAVNNMISSGLEGARFVVANTDAQCLEFAKTEKKIQLGETITRGLGAGASPDVGKAAAEEAIEQIKQYLADSNMVFITAGMGGGTGTGAAPVIAKTARELGILTVGVVTKPFQFEGAHRMKIAESGLAELQNYVDTLIVIPNQNLFRIANEKTTFADAFKMADDVLRDGVRSITDLMIMPGLINLDFADIRSVMNKMGKAMMGTGEAEGENRAIVAAEAAISNPLLDNSSMKGAKGVLINITGGSDMTLFEVDEAANRIREEVDQEANIIFGSAFNENLEGKIRVSVVATGIEDPNKNNMLHQNKMNQHNNIFQKAPFYFTEKEAFVAPKIEELVENNAEEQQVQITENAEIENHEIADQNANKETFFMPKPEEVKDHMRSEHREQFAFVPESRNTQHQPKKSPGFFERVANSVGLTSKRNQHEDNDYRLTQSEKEISNYQADREFLSDEIVDVPAYLRRKK